MVLWISKDGINTNLEQYEFRRIKGTYHTHSIMYSLLLVFQLVFVFHSSKIKSHENSLNYHKLNYFLYSIETDPLEHTEFNTHWYYFGLVLYYK